MNRDIIYLDYAAATPLDERVLAAMQPYLTDKFYNPSSPYAPAVEVRRDYEEAKAVLARAIGAKGDELVMTAGATESVNIAFAATAGHVVASSIEHHAVLNNAKARRGTLVKPDKKGIVHASDIANAITPETELVSVALANNELGTLQPLRDIAEVVHAERTRRLDADDRRPIYMHADASQGLGLTDVNVGRLGVDMLTLNAAKVYGPKQVGLLWLANHVHANPYVIGGGQERGLRSGTENVAGVIGFAKAVELAEKKRKSEWKRMHALRDVLRDKLVEALPDVVVSGDAKRQLPNFLHVSFPGVDAERVIFMLEAQHIYVATGSACAANKGTRSYVLTEIGLAPEVADGSIRISLGRYIDEEKTQRAADSIIDAVRAEHDRTG